MQHLAICIGGQVFSDFISLERVYFSIRCNYSLSVLRLGKGVFSLGLGLGDCIPVFHQQLCLLRRRLRGSRRVLDLR